jgi:lipopolysaccharide heptosyltransferase II
MDSAPKPLVERRFLSILALDFSLVGDLLMLTPALRRLRDTYSGARLSLAAQPFALELFSGGNLVDEVIPYDKRGEDRGARGVFRLAGRLKQRDFDAAFVFHRSFGSALAVWLARVPVRVGYRHELRDFLLTHRVRETELQGHIISEHLNLLDEVGIPGGTPPLELDIDLSHEDEFLTGLSPRLQVDSRPLIVVCPKGGWPTKTWPVSHINRFLDLFNVHSVTFVLVGAPGEEEHAEEIYSVNNDIVNLVGKTSLRELAYILKRADVVVSPDTGTVHLAAALGTPVVALFGPTAPERCGPPPYVPAAVISGEVNCLKCYLKKCTKDPFCMDTIAPEKVKAEVDRYIAVRRAAAEVV